MNQNEQQESLEMGGAAYMPPRAESFQILKLNLFASLSAEGGLGEYEDDGEL